MSTIILPGLTANDPVPGSYINVGFAQGASAGASAARDILIIARKSSAGSATPDTMIYGPASTPSLVTDADAVSLFGSGSPAHRMFRRIVKVNPSARVHVICPADVTGAAATGTITFANSAGSAGTLKAFIDEEQFEISVAKNAAAGEVAASLAASINAKTSLGVTATVSLGVVTLTDKVKGSQAHFSRYNAMLIGVSGMTVTPTAPTAMSGGDSTQVNYANALATIKPLKFYYIVSEQSPVSGASGAFADLTAQVEEMQLPINGIRQRIFVGSNDSLANTVVFAKSVNHPRAEVVWFPESDRRPEELAATAMGVYSFEEAQTKPRANFCGYGSDSVTAANWDLKAPRSGRAITRSEIVAALNNGISPVAVGARGISYLVSRITTYSQNGLLADYRIRPAHKVTYADFFADDWDAIVGQKFSGKKIGNDPVEGQRAPGPDVVTPTVFKAELVALLRKHEAEDRIENVDKTIQSLVVIRESNPTSRLSARAEVDFIDIADQFATDIAQVG